MKFVNYLTMAGAFWLLILATCLLTEASTSFPKGFQNITLPMEEAPKGLVPLENGHFSKKVTKNGQGAFYAEIEKVATYKWKGKNVAALVLSYNTGGSGVFKRLYFLTLHNNKWLPKWWLDIGDRTPIRYLSLYRHGKIYVGMVDHGDDDPMCCPTKRVLRIFDVTEKGLRPSGTFDVDLFPDEIMCKPGLILHSWHMEIIPQISFSPHTASVQGAIPTHVALMSGNRIIMRVINLKKYKDMWLEHGDPSINIAIRRLKNVIRQKPSLLQPPFDLLPPRPGLNDFALFLSKISFKTGTGFGFVGRVVKDLICVDKSQLHYFFMGIDKEGKYLISLSKKVRASDNVPNKLWMCDKGVPGVSKQIEDLRKSLSDLGEDKAFPELPKLKRFISTIEIREKTNQ